MGEDVAFTEINDKDGRMPVVGCIFKDGDFIFPEKEKEKEKEKGVTNYVITSAHMGNYTTMSAKLIK